ncbi:MULTISPECIES: DUF6915 family protein [unclassified Calothrix]|uniref:DUF6915 family protein n=1 Tax=unclassified Calothrix TaxID=2619626 RepID=UPI0018EFF8EC|nr:MULTISPECIES: hypothetical protein [unclassified Calothrix]
MAKPWDHAIESSRKFGGKPEDYFEIHQMIDSSKSAHATMKHRCVFHNSFGIYLIERIFGINITNSNGKLVSVREIAELHVLSDLGKIPSLDDWMKEMELKPWMGQPTKVVYEYKLGE